MGSALELYSYIHLLLETWLFLKYIYIFSSQMRMAILLIGELAMDLDPDYLRII